MKVLKDIVIAPVLLLIIVISYWYGFAAADQPALDELKPVTGKIVIVKEYIKPGSKSMNPQLHLVLEKIPAIFVVNRGDNLSVGNLVDDNSLDYDVIKNTLKSGDEVTLWALKAPGFSDVFDADYYKNRTRDDVVNTGYDNPTGLSTFDSSPPSRSIADLPEYEVQQLMRDGQMLVDYQTMTAARSMLGKFFKFMFFFGIAILAFLVLKYLLIVTISIIQSRRDKKVVAMDKKPTE